MASPRRRSQLNDELETYGRSLWIQGRPYHQLADLLTGVQAKRREVRASLSRASDVAFQWLEFEPWEPTPPITRVMLQANVALALFLGWPRLASEAPKTRYRSKQCHCGWASQ